MGGKEGSRGYVYQGIVSVLHAFQDQNWDRIQIEFPTDGDKVDIALSQGAQVVMAIQVKSTVNSFSPEQVRTWTQQLVSDYPCPKYEVVLIGQCSEKTIAFTKAVEKYYSGSLDKEAEAALSGFPKAILGSAYIRIRRLPFDLDVLSATVRDALFQFISAGGASFKYEQVRLLANAAIGEHLVSSTNGTSLDRKSFEEGLHERIKWLSSYLQDNRTPICICSFDRGVNDGLSRSQRTLDLRRYFTGAKLATGYEWNRDLFPELEQFFSQFGSSEQYSAFLEAHTSLSFAAGRICDPKSGIDIVPYQKTSVAGLQLWAADCKTAESYPGWDVRQRELSVLPQQELALVINGTHDILEDVTRFIEQTELPIGKIISCTVKERGAGHESMIDGYHAWSLANDISSILDHRTAEEKRAVVHLFISAPRSFAFYLGKVSRMFGKINLYEHDPNPDDGIPYIKSFSF